ncbi:MAG: DEAD/DEAH box helicase family protein, partial [Shewanella oncorhynchi]
MTNLELCLRELPFDYLMGILPEGSIDFVDSLGYFDAENGSLARAVSISSASSFILDKVMRDKLIRSINVTTFKKIFGDLFNNKCDINYKAYEDLILWADNVDNHSILASKLGIPEHFCKPSYESHLAQNSVINVPVAYPLYPYQQVISDQAYNQLNGKSKVVIHLPTGAGKTRTGMDIVVRHLRANPKNLVLWLADREELCEQAMSEFKKAWGSCGNRNIKAYGYYASSNESLSGIDSGIIVGSLQAM